MIQLMRSVRYLTTAAMKQAASELSIPVPWGEVRGQVWGPEHGRPVLCLHGWSDNSGSFNTLVPQLPSDCRYVAVDMPGHGLSSHRPAGVFYTFPAYIADVRRVVEALQWKRFSIIGHSMGGNIAGMFSAAFPEMVDAVVLLDSYGILPLDVNQFPGMMKTGIEEMIQYEKKAANRTERVYTYEMAKDRLKMANSSLSDESLGTLLERGVKEVEGGVVFTRDIRINMTNIVRITLEQSLQMQKQITAKVLIICATHGLEKSFPLPEHLAVPIMKCWMDQGQTIVSVEGDHHVHLNNPEIVAPIVADFLQSTMSEYAADSSKL